MFKTRLFLAKRKFISCYNMGFTFSIDYGRKYVIFIELRMKGGPTVYIKGKINPVICIILEVENVEMVYMKYIPKILIRKIYI